MAIDERARRELYDAAERNWGSGPADALMELLPPVGWADVATKRDLTSVKTELQLQIQAAEDRLGGRIDNLRAEFHSTLRQELRTFLMWTVGTVVTTVVGGLIAAVVAIAQIT